METILNLLRNEARLSDNELAAMTNMSVADVTAQRHELEQNGSILGYTAIVNEDLAVQDDVTALIEVKVTPKAGRGFDEIAEIIASYDEVVSLTLMSGSFDLAVIISGTNHKDLAMFVSQKLSVIEGVIGTSTSFYLKRYKKNGRVAVNAISDKRGFVSP